MDCNKCTAKCCQDQPSMFLFPPDVNLFEQYDATITRYGPFGHLETNCGPCPALNQETHRCTIYAERPLVCRIYPFNLIIVTKTARETSVVVDLGACPQHRRATPIPNNCDFDLLTQWYGVSTPLFWGGIARVFLKELWRAHVEASIAPADLERLNLRRQKDLDRALQASVLIDRPLLPAQPVAAVAEVTKCVFHAFRDQFTAWTTRALCEWVEPRIVSVVMNLYQLEVQFP